ncbi:hypothetical protein K0C01_04870 [Salinarchaeum sp. IM2453]|uniref:hypothetical protein n=1 Tax=Salinarchaeum sp. IM2453 TaxID=2862870 RepID=UPI001C834AFB|nr:hypothetical protein [Salinarchaeum sp. IM2453]QZA89472.1 hypothetical protein K0C01_04870 [Salinarchaeum sp. IM2453]
MNIRDAVEADAEAMVDIADAPADVMRNLIHDRTVRVAEPEEGINDMDPHADTEARSTDLLGFVSFDARDQTVYITQLDGTKEACKQLLGEPIRFAEQEDMDIELLVPLPREDIAEAAEEVGFRRSGRGPDFEGTPTIKYRKSRR